MIGAVPGWPAAFISPQGRARSSLPGQVLPKLRTFAVSTAPESPAPAGICAGREIHEELVAMLAAGTSRSTLIELLGNLPPGANVI